MMNTKQGFGIVCLGSVFDIGFVDVAHCGDLALVANFGIPHFACEGDCSQTDDADPQIPVLHGLLSLIADIAC
jgi:hypothetical protein